MSEPTMMEVVTKVLARDGCKCCTPGSFDEAYHRLQNAPDRMIDSLFMFEAGKKAERTFAAKQFKTKLQAAVAKAINDVVKGESK